MRAFFVEFRAAIISTIVLALVCSGLYPLVVYGLGQVLFAEKANGSLIVGADGAVHGSKLLGQGFTDPKYFHPRPSAAGNGYDAVASGGSNLGPTSQKLADAIKDRVAAYGTENNLGPNDSIPADAVTASGSGLDPHISPRNAELQIPRVAKSRGIAPETLRELVQQYIDKPDLGILGDPGVNVLRLNLALDASTGSR
jgi:K+-transporting ATPase ATPase C chain